MGRLLSINIGGPREVTWQGRTVRTAIWKNPVAAPRMVRRINIDGDDQGDRVAHGGEHRAVFVESVASTLTDLGHDPSWIRIERFGNSEEPP